MRIALILLLILPLSLRAATYASDGSNSDVQTLINAGADGDTITIPSGSFTWTGAVTLSKAIHLQGGGSGRVIGRSASSVAIGTGAKTFTTQSGLAITAGQTLRIERTGTEVSGGVATGTRTWMEGTVTSYTSTSLVMDIASTAGSGTHPVWIIITSATTTITHSAGANVLLTLTESTAGNVQVSGLRFVTGTGTDDTIRFGGNGQPVLIHDCYFQSTSDLDCIQTTRNRGIIYRCSFVAFPFAESQVAVHQKNAGAVTSWTALSTMGTNDTGGTNNLYIEDCDFHAWLNCTDFDDNGKVAMRNCLFNNAGNGTHGADTSDVGVRHYEVYNSEFVFNGFGSGQTLNLNWWFYLRGGTGVIASNTIPDLSSSDYGNKSEVNAIVMNLQRAGGPNGCYGANVVGNQYPAPRQVGMGRVTGASTNDSITYAGDSEPLYIWGNSGTCVLGQSNYGGSDCTLPDSSVDYIVSGRDFFNDGTAKPNWSPYTYPHPLTVSSGTGGAAGTNTITRSGSRSFTGNRTIF